MNKKELERLRNLAERVYKEAERDLTERQGIAVYPDYDKEADAIIYGIADDMHVNATNQFLEAVQSLTEQVLDILKAEDWTDTEKLESAFSELEIEPDVYTSDLIAWLGSDEVNLDFLTNALQLYGVTDGFRAVSTAQVLWKQEILSCLLNYLFSWGEQK